MLKHVKTKILIVFLFSALIIMIFAKAKAVTYYVTSGTFTSIFPTGSNLAFQHGDRYVTLHVANGTLNSSLCRLKMYDGGGEYRFTANETASLQITYNVSNVKVNGNVIASGDTASMTQSNLVVIQWDMVLEPMWPIMFVLGMVGLFGLFLGPMYGIHQVKNGKKYDGFRFMVIVTSIGFALFIAWLGL